MIERIQRILNQGREMAVIDPSLSQPLKGLESTLIQVEEIALVFKGLFKKGGDQSDEAGEDEQYGDRSTQSGNMDPLLKRSSPS